MTTVFSNKNSIWCIMRHRLFNKISYEKLSDLELVLKDCQWTRKELELIFSPDQVYSIWKSAIKKGYSGVLAHLFFSQIYTAWKMLIWFAYSSIPVCFRAIAKSFLSLLSQKTYPGIFKTRGYFKQKLSEEI